MKSVDVLVIGGGINGAGIARDCAGRGLTVLLAEKDDLANATSSASTKLIHGGLRYLEHFEFGLVRSALKEREVLLRAAPHIIRPLTFILPHHRKLRPWWMIRMGLFLYDFLAPRKTLMRSRSHTLTGTLLGAPLKPEFQKGFSYADCWVEDSRLVVLNALDAAEHGATILTRTECLGLARNERDEGWIVTLHDHLQDKSFRVKAKMVVNAAGPWVSPVLNLLDEGVAHYKTRLVKGSHIIVKRLYKGDHAYILQNDDKRIVFAIPYERDYTLIGTTDVEYEGDPAQARITDEEVDYLCAAVSRFFRQKVTPDDVQWTYSGVRPLLDDGDKAAKNVTRDYKLDMADYKGAPILSVFGGKLTTYRVLSEKAANMIVAKLEKGKGAWTAQAPLPGAETAGSANFTAFYKTFKREFNWLPENLLQRYARSYGARAREMLRGFKRMSDLGEHLGDGIYELEVAYLARIEWAMTADDILWRRSKLGLHVSDETRKKIDRLLKKHLKALSA